MKKKLSTQKTIVFSLFLSAILVTGITSNAQQERKDSLICDETNWRHTRSGFSIITSNDEVFNKLKEKFEEEIRSYTVRNSFDRHGKSKSYTIFFYPEREKEITDFLAD